MPLRHCTRTDDPAAASVLWIVGGALYLSEGIREFLGLRALEAGRLARTGVPLLVTMVIAMISTKGPGLGGHSLLGSPHELLHMDVPGSVLHEARTEVPPLVVLPFLPNTGACKWPVEAPWSPRGAGDQARRGRE